MASLLSFPDFLIGAQWLLAVVLIGISPMTDDVNLLAYLQSVCLLW